MRYRSFLFLLAIALPAAADDYVPEPEKLKHWAWKAPALQAPPTPRDQSWPKNAVDRFILAKLEAAKLKPARPATHEQLIRRVTLDLIGLPPTPAEIDAFLNDNAPDAWENVVDRLLNSPHYGERWGRHWLDAARYADSDGFEKDKSREVWFYRDWVIKAFNDDMPYDRFVIEQIGGDQLPNASQDQLVATGFLRHSMLNEEGAIDPEQFRMEGMFDRMDAIGKSVLGLTIQCAQCHNHKYDPISQEEYYRLFAFLNEVITDDILHCSRFGRDDCNNGAAVGHKVRDDAGVPFRRGDLRDEFPGRGVEDL
jgi:hypothetical protein